MRFDVEECPQIPWKNRGGTTRELAICEEKQQLVWRLSLADIGADGPFSAFPGLARVHTIISGQGLRLSGGGETLHADLLRPLVFDGELSAMAHLNDGPCRALNIIYDPKRVTASVRIQTAGRFISSEDETIIFVVSGTLTSGDGSIFLPGQGGVLPLGNHLSLSEGGQVIVMDLTRF